MDRSALFSTKKHSVAAAAAPCPLPEASPRESLAALNTTPQYFTLHSLARRPLVPGPKEHMRHTGTPAPSVFQADSGSVAHKRRRFHKTCKLCGEKERGRASCNISRPYECRGPEHGWRVFKSLENKVQRIGGCVFRFNYFSNSLFILFLFS